MYPVLLFIHSWLRYFVLGFGIWLLVSSALRLAARSAWSERNERVHVLFLAILDTQFLIGLALYFVFSPITSAAMHNFGAAMKDAQLRFFGVEHITTMLIALIVAHVGRVRSKRKAGSARPRSVLITQLVWLLLTAAAIPWPGIDVARPLFRAF
jgi:hypothetical protein